MKTSYYENYINASVNNAAYDTAINTIMYDTTADEGTGEHTRT